MALDTLEVFGVEYTNVKGFKATDDQGNTKTYIRPQGTMSISANGNGIDVTEYAAVDVAVPAPSPSLQNKTVSPTTSQQTIQADGGYDGLGTVTVNAMPSGTAGTPTATKGAVSNHSVSVTPSVTNSAGYITSETKTGTAVTVSASELVSGSLSISANNTYDVTNYASAVVNVSGGKNAQIASGVGRVASTSYTAVSGQSITVAKTGTYNVYWSGYRSSTSGTNGSQLYIGSSSYGSAVTTFDGTYTNWQIVHLSNVSLTQNQVVTVRARSRGTSYYMYVANLTIIEA